MGQWLAGLWLALLYVGPYTRLEVLPAAAVRMVVSVEMRRKGLTRRLYKALRPKALRNYNAYEAL